MEKSTEGLTDHAYDELCGVCSWRPKWLQKLANRRVYTISFVVIGMVQGMIFSYFNAVLNTVEKAFGIRSSVLGIILSGNDVSQILCGVLISYIAGRGSRPFWLAVGMLVTASACFVYASAQFLYNEERHLPDILLGTGSHRSKHLLCTDSFGNKTADDGSCENKPYSSNISVLVIFFMGQFISGIGNTTLFTLGFTYMDDSVKKSSSPLYLAITSSLRSLGPTMGYVLSSVFLKVYISPGTKPAYDQHDPRWLGAWWLGFLLIGSLMIVCTFPMLLFPKELPIKEKKKSKEGETKASTEQLDTSVKRELPTAKDFMKTMGRILKNPVIIFHMFSIGPLFLGIVGFSTFLPKYLEAQFGQTASQASILTGAAGMMMMMAGVFLGGLIIWKLQPPAYWISIASGVANIIYAVGLFVMMSFKCNDSVFPGVYFDGSSVQMTSSCNQECNCDGRFDPICLGSQNYLSPCTAGCTSIGQVDNKMVFLNCSCAANIVSNLTSLHLDSKMMLADIGYCPGSRNNCTYLWPYIIILAVSKLIVSATRVGNILILIRSVHKLDKSVAMALSLSVVSILGFIPGPIVYGGIADATCMLWETKACGEKGNCWLYDMDSFRLWYHGVTIGCFLFAAVFELLLSVYARQMNLYSDDPPSRVLSFCEGFRCKKEQVHTTCSVSSGLEIVKARY